MHDGGVVGLEHQKLAILILGAIFVTVNIIVDIIVAWLDPRIRLSAARSE